MKRGLAFVTVFLCLLSATLADDYEVEYRDHLQSAFESIKEQSPDITDQTNLTDWSMSPIGSDFNCIPFEKSGTAKTVHELTPYDIQVVGALGDSVTAAMGAKACTLLTDLIEYRGVSWSVGGDSDLSKVTTLPNIIKKYNPNVKGYSKGILGSNAWMNVAVSGGIAENMPSQARKLVDKMKSDSRINFENDWKLVTLWIGGNDLCRVCNNKEKHSAENYCDNIKEALDILHKELPRTFVNLVQIIDVTRLAPLRGLVCNAVHLFACKCAAQGEGSETSQASTDYQEALNELIASGRYNTKDDFTVVVQPFFEGVELPYANGKPDKSYFAPDCFHFSTKGHREGAVALWNNMLEPVGSKTTGWTPGGGMKCPTEDNPYFYTEKNSNQGSVLNAQGTEGQSNDSAGSDRYVVIVTGSTIGVCFLVVVIIIVVVIMATKQHQRKIHRDTERIALISD